MTYDPLEDVEDHPLDISDDVLVALKAFREKEKVCLLPGVDTRDERRLLNQVLNDLVDRLLQGIQSNPSKLWTLAQFQESLLLLEQPDTEVREHFGMELEEIMDILSIESSDGLLSYHLGGL